MIAELKAWCGISGPALCPCQSACLSCLQGESNTTDYRLFLQQEGKDVSSWHDIPLRNDDGTLNFVCEIPKETSAKMEVATVRCTLCLVVKLAKMLWPQAWQVCLQTHLQMLHRRTQPCAVKQVKEYADA